MSAEGIVRTRAWVNSSGNASSRSSGENSWVILGSWVVPLVSISIIPVPVSSSVFITWGQSLCQTLTMVVAVPGIFTPIQSILVVGVPLGNGLGIVAVPVVLWLLSPGGLGCRIPLVVRLLTPGKTVGGIGASGYGGIGAVGEIGAGLGGNTSGVEVGWQAAG